MNAEAKEEIRKRIHGATGHDVGEIQPQFFIGNNANEIKISGGSGKVPNFRLMLIEIHAPGIQPALVKVFGCN